MLKKLILLLAVVVFGAWAAGYDFVGLKDQLVGASNSGADSLSGSSERGDGWAPSN